MKFFNFVILFCFIPVTITAQINIRSIESFSVEDGLSQTSVHTIFQDSKGLLWFGTEGGINKFDGYEIAPFKSVDSRNILSSRGTIYDILEDQDGNLWYGSTGLVSRLNIYSETSDNLELILKNKFNLEFGVVLCLFQDSKGNIWFGTFGQGVFKISSDFTEFKNYINDPENTSDSSLDYVRDFYEDNNGVLWIATYGGLVKFNLLTEKFENIFYRKKLDRFKHVTIYKIIPSGNELMLFTSSDGILVYNIINNTVYDYDTKINDELANYPLRNAVLDKKGRIWICVYGKGIVVLEPGKKEILNLLDFINPEYKQALIEPLSIHIDTVGIIWVGTQHNGFYKLTPGEKNVNLINSSVKGFENIQNNITNAVAKDTYGIIWFATNDGLFKINPKQKSVRRMRLSNQFSPFMLRIFNITFTDNFAWLSLGPYLIKHEIKQDKFEKIEIEKDGSVTEVAVADNDLILVGTTMGNIYTFQPSSAKLTKITIGKEESLPSTIIDCYVENKTELWVGTNNGLFYLDLSKDSLKSEKIDLELKLDFITSIAAPDKQKLWFGTYGDGLFSYDRTTKELNHFTLKDGLPDNTVYGVMVDPNKNLWMSSNRGIFEFNPETNTVKTFDLSDGLQSYEFNSKSYSKSEDGEFFYGGVNGCNYFYPMKIERNEIPPKILIEKVLLYDSVIVSNISSGFNTEFEFSYYQNSISFEFTALDYMNPSKNNYEYKLAGVNNNWIKAGNKRYATFPNINPGKYNFVVRGSNSDQVYNEAGVSFTFIIHPPFWATWWFRTLLISAALLVLYSIYKLRMINQEKRLREIESIRKRIADDFHDDLGHKLTRISLYSEMIRNQEELGTNKQLYLDKISEASNSLFYETKDFIWSIDPENDTVYDVLVYLKDFGDEFFNKSGIAFKVEEIDEKYRNYSLPMKWKREIVLIFKEVMNNVIKHSQADTAELKADISDDIIKISLLDDGTGFDSNEKISGGRGLKSINKRAKILSGKVSIESNNNGTLVQLLLNIEKDKK